MKTEEKDILVTLIQGYAAGKVNPGFNPQALVEAISQTIDFNQPIDIFSANKNSSVVKKLTRGVKNLKTEMESELKKLDKEEKLFANFLRGKITAYQEIIDLLK